MLTRIYAGIATSLGFKGTPGYRVIKTSHCKPLLLSKDQVLKIKLELHSLALDREGVGSPHGATWAHQWMCCTLQAHEIHSIVKRYPILRELNRSWLATHPYANGKKVVFPIQSVLEAEGYRVGQHTTARTVELRKELFDHWCKQLIGEYIREDSKILN